MPTLGECDNYAVGGLFVGSVMTVTILMLITCLMSTTALVQQRRQQRDNNNLMEP